VGYSLPVDSIAIHDAFVDVNNNLQMALEVFPDGKTHFGEQDVSDIGFILSNQTYKPPSAFGPYYFIGQHYSFANGKSKTATVSLKQNLFFACVFITLLLCEYRGTIDDTKVQGQPYAAYHRGRGWWRGSRRHRSCSCYPYCHKEEDAKEGPREERAFWSALKSPFLVLQ
jgi:hypothetical protein